MKCFACGYEDTEQEPVKTENICIHGTGRKEPFARIGPVMLMDDTYFGAGGYTHKPLYACPNCGTVKMNTGC